MTSLEEITDEALVELSRRGDDLGVLSVYADARPGQEPNLNGVAIDLKNRYRELRRRVAEDHEHSNKVSAALEHVRPMVDSLAHPAATGRGRILFVSLSDGRTLHLDSAMPVANRVVLDDYPFIHPLLELLDNGRPAGLLLVSPDAAHLLEWRLGRLRLLGRMEQQEVEAPHERAGQIGGGPPGQFHTPMREQRQSRQRDRTERFLDQVVTATVRLAAERRWRRVIVSGGERWTDPVASRWPSHLRDTVIREPRIIRSLDEAALSELVTTRLRDEHAAQHRRLVEQVRDAAHERRGALGLSEVAAALNMGRAAHLVYDPEVRYTGSVGADGALYAGQETAPDGHPSTPEPRLTERLVERALATGSPVSPVNGAARGALEDANGIAALLRW